MPKTVSTSIGMIVILGLLLGACAPAAAPTPAPQGAPTPGVPSGLAPTPLPATPESQLAEKPRYGGILRVPQKYETPTFDLHQASTIGALHPIAPMYNMLVQQDTQDYTKIVPDLAEKWEVTPDGLTWTFYLAKGVKWHDGKPFSSADVKASLEKIYNPKPGVISLRKDTLASIKSVETSDESRVVIKLKQPSASLLLNLSAGWNVIYPKHILDVKGTMQKDINGTGPFKMGEYVRGVEWTEERNPEYFKKGLPYLDGLKYYIILDQASRFAALRTKRVHATGIGMEILPDEITVIQREAPEIVIQKHWMLFWAGINLPLHRFPWSDIRARQALSLAFNREEAWNVVDYGWGLKGGVMATQGEWGLPLDKLETIPGYGPWKDSNIAEAKKLLKEAGIPEGYKTVLLVRQGEDYVKLAVVMQNVLAKLGIPSTLLIKETAAWYEAMYAIKSGKHTWEGFDLNAWLQGAALDDPDFIFGDNAVSGAVRNLSDYSNPRLDELYLKQSQTMDPVERKKLINEMDYTFLSEFGKIMLYWRYKAMASWPEMKGYKIANIYYNNARLEDVWLAK